MRSAAGSVDVPGCRAIALHSRTFPCAGKPCAFGSVGDGAACAGRWVLVAPVPLAHPGTLPQPC
eukprot:248198-Alexandrium_andersonii.AAC.1